MASGPNVHGSMEKLLEDQQTRITLLERRLAIQGGGGGGGDAVFAAGTVMSWAGTPSGVPNGWLLCDGRAISRSAYPNLFAAISTTYGAGDGSTTFNLPNGKGRVVVGQDGAQVEFDVVGETGGAKTVALTEAQMPAHGHNIRYGNPAGGDGSGVAYSSTAGSTSSPLQVLPAGGSQAHENLQPYIVQNWIISTGAGSTNPAGAVVPVNLWQEFRILGSGIIPAPSSSPKWDGPVTGTLGATLSADMLTITLPAAGTYRMIPHIGLSGSSGAAANANANVNSVNVSDSFSYGAMGPAGAWSYDTEFVISVTGPSTLRYYVNTAGVYNWSHLRIEKLEPFFPQSALTVNQGSTAQRDAIYGVPTTDQARASLANRVVTWFNTDKGWHEVYYATTGIVGLTAKGLLAGHASGWYPSGAVGLVARRGKTNGYQVIAANSNVDPVLATLDVNRGGFLDNAGSGILVPYGGRYQVHASIYYTGGTTAGQNLCWCRLFNDGVLQHDNLTVRPLIGSDHMVQTTGIMTVVAGKAIAVSAQTQSTNVSLYGPNGFQTYIEVSYLGPPLVNG